MKKLFLGVFAAAGLLFAASCQQDEMQAARAAEEATLSFSLNVEGQVQTRAISDGTTANRLVYAVFDNNGNRITTIEKVDKAVTFPVTEQITLAKGQTYQVVFWAQNSASTAYELSNDMILTIDYEARANNAEVDDAFFKAETFTVTGDSSFDIALKRPFAQLNVGVTDADMQAAKSSGLDIVKSKVVISEVANKMNLLDGTVKGAVDVEYALAAIPTEKLTVSEVEYNYLSMSYILPNPGAEADEWAAGEGKTTLGNVEFTFTPQTGNDIVIGASEGLSNVPVQRNWRTNIIGKLLTGDLSCLIEIDPVYQGEHQIKNGEALTLGVRSEEGYYASMAEAIADGASELNLAEGTYQVPESAKNSGSLNFVGTGDPENTTISCTNGNDSYYLSNVEVGFENLTIETDNQDYSGFKQVSGATFKNCIIKNTLALYNNGTAPLLFENCTFQIEGNRYNVWTWGVSAIFKNCVFNCDGKAMLVYGGGTSEVTFQDCIFNATTSSTGKAAIETGNDYGATYTLKINNCQINGFDVNTVSNSNVWGNKNSMDEDHLKVFIDGTQVYGN